MKTKPLKYPKSYGVRDEFDALYSADGSKLLKYDNDDLETDGKAKSYNRERN